MDLANKYIEPTQFLKLSKSLQFNGFLSTKDSKKYFNAGSQLYIAGSVYIFLGMDIGSAFVFDCKYRRILRLPHLSLDSSAVMEGRKASASLRFQDKYCLFYAGFAYLGQSKVSQQQSFSSDSIYQQIHEMGILMLGFGDNLDRMTGRKGMYLSDFLSILPSPELELTTFDYLDQEAKVYFLLGVLASAHSFLNLKDYFESFHTQLIKEAFAGLNAVPFYAEGDLTKNLFDFFQTSVSKLDAGAGLDNAPTANSILKSVQALKSSNGLIKWAKTSREVLSNCLGLRARGQVILEKPPSSSGVTASSFSDSSDPKKK